MTAPLPPWTDPIGRDEIESYCKLAVRKALERAAVECEATLVREGFHSAFRCAANVRAMIEDYK